MAADVWTLERAGRSIGEVRVDDSDFPWLHGAFVALDGFPPWAPLFAQELALLEAGGDLGEQWEELWTRLDRDLDLVDPEGKPVESFLLHVEEGRAWFRLLRRE
ncbi:hypothetical protein ACIBH1_15115 [Nonomuraea sp. NPDC050663]|uniref:hypothetical protein n=1 Tax=Nonomuraea sp. NPDC050663 TaxID=3364370 RepID=UPI00379D8678